MKISGNMLDFSLILNNNAFLFIFALEEAKLG